MHAKASIPAWAKLFAISIAAVAIIALLIAAPWRSATSGPCTALLENIDLVQRGVADRRVSEAHIFSSGSRGGIGLRIGEGDFSAALTLDGARTCLGPNWAETHATAQAQDYGDAWVFTRSGAPLVMYVQSRTERYRRVEMQIVIERTN
jgi:hypothetical protein